MTRLEMMPVRGRDPDAVPQVWCGYNGSDPGHPPVALIVLLVPEVEILYDEGQIIIRACKE